MSGPDGGWGQPPGHQGGSFGPTPPSAFGNAPQPQAAPTGQAPFPAAQPPPPKKRRPWLWAIVLAPVAMCCFGGIALFGFAGYSTTRHNDLKAVCDSGTVAAGAAYTAGASNEAVGFERTASGSSWAYHAAFIPSSRQSADTASTNLVVCVETETEERVERCPYDNSGGGINILDRNHYMRRVRIIAPRTAEVILDQFVYGTEPVACEEWESFATTGTFERHGGHVTDAEISDLVVQHL